MPLGERRGLLEPVPDEDGELVAAEPGDQVAVPDGGAQPAGDLTSSWSPASCPATSLTALKPSRSRSSRQAGSPAAARARAAPARP